MARDGFMIYTGVTLGPVVAELGKIGEQQLHVSVTYQASKYARPIPFALRQAGNSQFQYSTYEFDVSDASSASLHLQFGLSRREALRAAALPITILLLPILIMLWMQFAAIRDAKQDPTAAWFSYFRSLNWCMNGVMLLWIVGNSVRRGAEDLAAYYLAGHDGRAIAIRLAILILPPWFVYIVCLLSSYRVYVQVRGNAWTRREFYSTQLLQVAAQLLPLMCLFAGIELLTLNGRAAIGCIVAFYFVLKICARLKLQAAKTYPEALTSGELRDRVFELAKKAAVEVRQIFIMPAGKSQLANAFASRKRIVIFTDYLLSRLNRREVSAVAAHEITHLQKKHATWKAVGLIALILSPSLLRGILSFGLGLLGVAAMTGSGISMARFVTVSQQVQSFPELDLIFYTIGLTLFYLQSRYMENSADAGAVRLTGDPEAVITGLLKLGHLNLLPIQWGRVTGSLLTHPSTLKRVQRVAKLGQVPDDRLQQLLMEQQQMAAQQGGQEPSQSEDTFTEAQAPRKRIVSAARSTQSAQYKLWMLWLFHIAPPALVAWSVGHWHPREKWAAYVGGAVISVALYFLVTRWMGLWGRSKMQLQFTSKLGADGISVGECNAQLVGVSPSAELRFYISNFNWDNGYLFFARDRLCYSGDQVSFALKPEQVRNVRLGPGVPGWTSVPRIYLDWWDEVTSSIRTWNMVSTMPCSIWKIKKQSQVLYDALQQWRKCPAGYPEAPMPLKDLPGPSTGEVTSRSLKSVYAIGRSLKGALWILFLAIALGTALSIPSLWYVCGVILLLRLYEALPRWFYKKTNYAMKSAAVAAATARI